MHQTCDSWAELESTLAQYKLSDSHIDDGIHWYAEQMIWAIRKLWLFVKSRKRATVCETGFGAGHASLLFLSVPGVSVHSFDILANKHQAVAADVVLDMVNSSYNIKTEKQGVILEENLITNIDATLAEVLEPRLFIHPGDTKRSLPQFVARAKSKNITCDLVFITVPEREWSDLLQLRVISQSWTWVMQGAFVGETEDYMNIWSKANSQGYICASQCFPAIKKREHKAVQVHGQKISGPFFCVAHYCSNNGVLHADRSHS